MALDLLILNCLFDGLAAGQRREEEVIDCTIHSLGSVSFVPWNYSTITGCTDIQIRHLLRDAQKEWMDGAGRGHELNEQGLGILAPENLT